jgi:hypothetical protein
VHQAGERGLVPRVPEKSDDEAGQPFAALLGGAVGDAGDDRIGVEAEVDDLAEEALFVAEVVQDEGGIDGRLDRDRADRRARVSPFAELSARGRSDVCPGAAVPRPASLPRCVGRPSRDLQNAIGPGLIQRC